MMIKRLIKRQKYFLSFVFLFSIFMMNAQDSNVPVKHRKMNGNKKLYISLGLNKSNFQDVKPSNVRYSGIGGLFNIGFSKTKANYFWKMAF